MGLGEPGEVDLAGDGDLDRVVQPANLFDGAGGVQQVVAGELPVLAVEQFGQSGAHLFGDAVRVGPAGHCAGHGMTLAQRYDSAPKPASPARPGSAAQLAASARQVAVLVMT